MKDGKSRLSKMIRSFKTLFTANLLLAMLAVGAYAVYGLASGLPIDERFLATGPGHLGRSAGPKIAPWCFTVFFEASLLVTFFICRYAEWDMTGHRIFCGIFGVLGVGGLLMAHLPQYNPFGEAEAIAVAVPPFDNALAWYVWCSHVVYAVTGPNDD